MFTRKLDYVLLAAILLSTNTKVVSIWSDRTPQWNPFFSFSFFKSMSAFSHQVTTFLLLFPLFHYSFPSAPSSSPFHVSYPHLCSLVFHYHIGSTTPTSSFAIDPHTCRFCAAGWIYKGRDARLIAKKKRRNFRRKSLIWSKLTFFNPLIYVCVTSCLFQCTAHLSHFSLTVCVSFCSVLSSLL